MEIISFSFALCRERVQEHHYGSSEDSFGLGFATRTCHVDVAERRQGGRFGICWKEGFGGFEPLGEGEDGLIPEERWRLDVQNIIISTQTPRSVTFSYQSQSCCRFYHLRPYRLYHLTMAFYQCHQNRTVSELM